MAVKNNLYLEERMKNALVPLDEQPYALPENWVWVRGESLFLPMVSKKPSANEFTYIDIDAIDNVKQKISNPKIIQIEDAPSRASRKISLGDTLFSLVRPYLKNIAYVTEEYAHAIASTGFYVCRPQKNLSAHYIFKLMCSDYVIFGLNKFMKGDNSPSIRTDDIRSFPFPLPPLAEQERIVQRIESLFSKLDTAKERIEASLASFEARKSALLHQAFTGELTRAWRDKHGVTLDSWIHNQLKNYADTKYGYTDSATKEHCSYKFLRITDIQNNTVDWSNVPYCKINEKDFKNYKLLKNDIVVARTGATTGKSYIITDEINNMKVVFASYLIKISIFEHDKLSGQYLYKFMQSQFYWEQITDLSSGIAQPGVNANKLKSISMLIPLLPEQKEIVRILNSLLAKEEQAKAQAQKSLDAISHMKQAILARAFRGELGTQDSTDEPAVLLLERILAEGMTTQAQKSSPSKAPKERKTRAKAPALPAIFPQPGREDRVLYLMECLIDEYPNMTMKEVYEMALLATMPSLWKKLLGKNAVKLTTILQNHAENWKFSVKEKVRSRRVWNTLEQYHNVIISEQGRCSLRQGYTSERMESYKKLLPFFYNAYSIFCNERHKYLDMDVKVQKMEWLEHIA